MLSSSSSCYASNTNLADTLSLPVSIVHCSREVFKFISYICTEVFYIGSSWSSSLCSSIWRGPQECFAYEFVLASLEMSRMFGSSNWTVFEMGGRWSYSFCFVGVASRTCSILLEISCVITAKLFLHTFS